MKFTLIMAILFISSNSFAETQKYYEDLYMKCFVKVDEIDDIFENEMTPAESDEFDEGDVGQFIEAGLKMCEAYIKRLKEVKKNAQVAPKQAQQPQQAQQIEVLSFNGDMKRSEQTQKSQTPQQFDRNSQY